MTSRNLFFNMMKEDLKQRLWAITLSFLGFFFMLPVASAMVLSERKQSLSWSYPKLLDGMYSVLGIENGFLAVFAVALALILGVNSFAWLHNKKKVDFYHSLPVRREKLFFVNFLDGILILVFSYGINVLLAVIVAAVNGVAPGDLVSVTLTAFGFFLLHFTLMYSVTVLSMMLTGSVLVGILGIGVFSFYFPALLAVIENLFQTFFLTSYYDGGTSLSAFLMDKCSPFTMYLGNFGVMGSREGGNIILRLVYACLVTAAFTAFSLILYRLRGSEAAGRAMAFQISRPIIRIPLVILAGISGGLFFWSLHSGMGWAVFGMLCGLLLMHCTMEIIYHFDFKKLFSNRISLAVCAAAAVLVFCFFRYDLPGYDRYVPNAGSLSSVALSFSNLDDWVSYGSVEISDKGDYYWDAQNPDEYLFSQMRLTDRDTALALVKAATEQVKIKKEQEEKGQEYRQEQGRYLSFSAKFTKTNGKAVYRSYSVNLPEDAYKLYQKIYDSRDYRLAAYPVLKQTPEDTGKVKVLGDGWSREVTRGNGKGEDAVDQLLTAYQEELTGLTSAQMLQENPIAKLQFMTGNQMAAEQKKGNDTSDWRFRELFDKGHYPIYPSFSKTIELLKKCGIDLETEAGNGIMEADIDLSEVMRGEDGESFDHQVSSEFAVTDPSELEQLMKTAILDDYSDMNPFWDRDQRLTFEVIIQGTSGQMKKEYSIKLTEIPDFLKKAAEHYWKEAVIES